MKRWLGFGVPIIVVLTLVGWRLSSERSEAIKLQSQQKGRSGQAPAVEVAEVESREIVRSIEAVGTLASPYSVKLSPKFAGRIEFLQVREGDRVIPAQVVARIDPSELDAQILAQQAVISESRSRLAQAELTAGANATGVESAVRIQKAGLESARADLLQAERNFDAYVGTAEAAVRGAEARLASALSEVQGRIAELKSAQAVERNSKARLERLESQLAKGFVSQQSVDDARLIFESAQASVGVRQTEVATAESEVVGARAVLSAAQKQLGIAKEKGQADIAAARARVKQAEALSAEAAANRSQTPAYRENLAALRASVQAAEAGLRQLQARRQDAELRSPIEGSVTERLADPGSMAGPGQTLVTVEYLKWLFADATIPVEHAAKVFVGQPVIVRIDALPNRTFTGAIGQINRSANPQSRQFNVKVRLENPNETLRPGMFLRLEVVTERVKAAAVVPQAAVSKGFQGETVTVVNDRGEAEVRKVMTGIADRQGIAILEGLRPGEKVVILSSNPLRDGQKVRFGSGP